MRAWQSQQRWDLKGTSKLWLSWVSLPNNVTCWDGSTAPLSKLQVALGNKRSRFDVPDCQWAECAGSQSSTSPLCNNGDDPSWLFIFQIEVFHYHKVSSSRSSRGWSQEWGPAWSIIDMQCEKADLPPLLWCTCHWLLSEHIGFDEKFEEVRNSITSD